MTAYNPAATMRHAADHLRKPPASPLAARIADLLDSAALDAEAIGPYPLLRPPARPVPEAVVTHVEGVPQ